MNSKTSSVVAQKKGQGERVQLNDGGRVRRKFLTTVAAAGAVIALLGVGSSAAQEKQKEPVKSAWPEDGDAPAQEKTFGTGNQYDMSAAPAKKIISQSEVERLIENAKTARTFGPSQNPWGGDEKPRVGVFSYSVKEIRGRIAFELEAEGGSFKETIFFEGLKIGDAVCASFSTKNNPGIEGSLAVFYGEGKLAVGFFDKNTGLPVLVQVSSKKNQRMPNFFEDGQVKPLKQAIGYENKDGEITIVSLPENPQQGDSVLMVKISKEGAISSQILTYEEEKIELLSDG